MSLSFSLSISVAAAAARMLEMSTPKKENKHLLMQILELHIHHQQTSHKMSLPEALQKLSHSISALSP